jgi:hypothetical protein
LSGTVADGIMGPEKCGSSGGAMTVGGAAAPRAGGNAAPAAGGWRGGADVTLATSFFTADALVDPVIVSDARRKAIAVCTADAAAGVSPSGVVVISVMTSWSAERSLTAAAARASRSAMPRSKRTWGVEMQVEGRGEKVGAQLCACPLPFA